jgi:FKBP-type peptidyl-prolyl cis-trans isomerase (trigger factor)
LEKIAETENVEVTDAEVEAEINTMVQNAHEHEQAEMRESFNTSRDAIQSMIKVRKAAERLIDIAKSSYTENREESTEKKEEPKEKEG